MSLFWRQSPAAKPSAVAAGRSRLRESPPQCFYRASAHISRKIQRIWAGDLSSAAGCCGLLRTAARALRRGETVGHDWPSCPFHKPRFQGHQPLMRCPWRGWLSLPAAACVRGILRSVLCSRTRTGAPTVSVLGRTSAPDNLVTPGFGEVIWRLFVLFRFFSSSLFLFPARATCRRIGAQSWCKGLQRTVVVPRILLSRPPIAAASDAIGRCGP